MKIITTLVGILIATSIYLHLQDSTIINLALNQVVFILALGLSITSASLYLVFFEYFIHHQKLVEFFSGLAVAFGAFVFPLLYFDVTFNAQDFLVLLFTIIFSVFLFFVLRLKITKISIAVALVFSVGFIFHSSGFFSDIPDNGLADNESEKYIFSALHDIKVDSFDLKESVVQDGGAIADVTGSNLILVTGRGEVLQYDLSGKAAVSFLFEIQFGLSNYKKSARSVNRWYRITDAFLDNNSSELFVTYTKWHEDRDCYTVNLDVYEFSRDTSTTKDSSEKLYESSPCIEHEVLNNETGGRILQTTESKLIFSVGSFKASERISLNEYRSSSYGKVMEYDRSTGKTRIFTVGHRNAQGLVRCEGNIYLTEHGPFGGDELNLLVEGRDYGWPESSFGTDYGKKVLTISGETGQHLKGQKPIYAWTPSIGISNAVCYQGQAFKNWEGDLLIASLNGLGSGFSIYRTRVFEGRAVSIERIEIGYKVRDLIELEDGRVLIWDGLNTISILSPATSEFASCSGCHSIRYRSHGVGPDLHGVVGAPIARHTDRYAYSDSLRNLSGTWTPERLHSFLKAPQEFAPGTTMSFDGIEDYEQRQKIIKYLEGVSSNR
tara:strand:+ start:21542 stop:23362 length:1821 start_codon:yes stop_codon:yes gene_type:complete